MKLRTLRHGSVGLSVVVALLSAGSAQASTTVSTTCTAPALSQPFLSYLDGNGYSAAPGESYDNFSGTGWTLSGGAKISTTTLADGTTGSVLTLPFGSKAVSPGTVCVNNTYPYMRTMFQQAGGGSVTFAMSYLQTNGTWKAPQNFGPVQSTSTAWGLTSQVKLPSGPYSGWNYAQITVTGGGKSSSSSSIYNLYLDPRLR